MCANCSGDFNKDLKYEAVGLGFKKKYVSCTVISDYPKALFLACSWFILVCEMCVIHGLFSTLEMKDAGPAVETIGDGWTPLGLCAAPEQWLSAPQGLCKVQHMWQ